MARKFPAIAVIGFIAPLIGNVVPVMGADRAAPAPDLTGSWSRLTRSEEHTSELQSQSNLVCRLLLEKKNKTNMNHLLIGYRRFTKLDLSATTFKSCSKITSLIAHTVPFPTIRPSVLSVPTNTTLYK